MHGGERGGAERTKERSRVVPLRRRPPGDPGENAARRWPRRPSESGSGPSGGQLHRSEGELNGRYRVPPRLGDRTNIRLATRSVVVVFLADGLGGCWVGWGAVRELSAYAVSG